MHLQIKTSIALIVLTILDLCSSVPNLADQTQINTNENSIFRDNTHKLTANSKHFSISDDHISSDKSETITFQRNNNDRSASAAADNSIIGSDSDHPNFLITNYLSDGEIERRIHFNGITAKETFVPNFRYVSYFLFLYNSSFFLLYHIFILNEKKHTRTTKIYYLLVKILISVRVSINLIDSLLSEIIRTKSLKRQNTHCRE